MEVAVTNQDRRKHGDDAAKKLLLTRWRCLPPVDLDALRADIDNVLDASL